jgi:hypothetical protein
MSGGVGGKALLSCLMRISQCDFQNFLLDNTIVSQYVDFSPIFARVIYGKVLIGLEFKLRQAS